MILSPIISSIGCANSALVADALREALEDATLEPAGVGHLVDFVDFSLKISRLDGPTFLQQDGYPETIEPSFRQHVRSRAEIAEIIGARILGEARHNADGGLDVLKWGRPQNDGPALRALAVMRFLALDVFPERAAEAALTLLRIDLDYTLSHWREPCVDLWEETLGFHYHTRLVQQAALANGATFWAAQADAGRAEACAEAARALLAELDSHFDPQDGVYRGRLAEAGANAPPPRPLDIAVILAAVHAGRLSGTHSVADPKMLATLFALERLFDALYPINRARPVQCAPALGRYASDSYFSGGAYYFSTLGAAQFYFLLAQAAAARRVDLGNARKPRVARRACCRSLPSRLRRARSRKNCAMRWPRRRCIAATCISRPCAASPRPRASLRNNSASRTASRPRLITSLGATPVS